MPVSWVEHRGQSILYVDYRNLGSAGCLETLQAQSEAVDASPGPVLTLVDARGARFDSEFMQAAKVAGARNNARTLKRAVVGAEGLKGLLLGFFNVVAGSAPMRPCSTIEEALDYLVEP
jgi:hypothetical protein